MKTLLKTTDRIRFQDCDPFNHLNNARYMDYFLHARELHIEKHYELNFRSHLAQTGKTWFIVSNQIAYFKPAKTGEMVVIDSKLIDFSAGELLVEFRMYDKQEEYLKSVAWTRFRYIDIQAQKTAEHPENLKQLFSKIVVPLDEKVFEQRAAVASGKPLQSL